MGVGMSGATVGQRGATYEEQYSAVVERFRSARSACKDSASDDTIAALLEAAAHVRRAGATADMWQEVIEGVPGPYVDAAFDLSVAFVHLCCAIGGDALEEALLGLVRASRRLDSRNAAR